MPPANQDPDPRLERAAVQMAVLAGEQGRGDSSKEGTSGKPYPAWVPATFEIFRRVFAPAKFNQEHEKRLKRLLGRARTVDVALDAIDLMYNEEVRYPQGYELRQAIDRMNLKYDNETPRESIGYQGPYVSFHEWYAAQDDDMKNRVRRVFPSLEVGL